MVRVCLVFPRCDYPTGDPPLGLLSIAAYMRESLSNLEMLFIDMTFDHRWSKIFRQIKSFKPNILGVYTDTLMLPDAKRIAKMGKSIGSFVVFGGPYVSSCQEVLKEDYVDAAALGEAEIGLTKLTESFPANRLPPGFFQVKGNKIYSTGTPERPDVNILPPPALDLIDMEHYIRSWYHLPYLKKIRGTSIVGSRGCGFNCSYCQPNLRNIFGPLVRYRKPSLIVEELVGLRRKYGINAFHLQDDTPTANKAWLRDFCQQLKKCKSCFYWSCNARVDTLDQETLKLLKDSGMVEIRLGIESWSSRVRQDIYNKKTTNTQIIKAIKMAKHARLKVLGYFMIGAPGETLREINSTIQFAVGSDLDMATFSIASLIPGTHMHKKFQKGEQTETVDYYKVGRGCLSDISKRKLDYHKKKAYLTFYLHPKRLLNTTLSILDIEKTRLKLLRF